MNMHRGWIWLAVGSLLGGLQADAASAALEAVASWPLPSDARPPTALAWDPVERRLFVAAEQADAVWVLDTERGRWLRPLSVPAPRHLLFEARPGLLYVSSGAAGGQVKILDVNARRTLKTIGNLPEAGRIHRDAPSTRIYVAYGAGALAVIHGVTGVHTLSVLLPDRPADFAIETVGHRIFVNLFRSNAVAVVDRLAREMTDVWPLPEGRGNESMALHEPRQRLYVGCTDPPHIQVLHTSSGKRVARLETPTVVQWLYVDTARDRLLAGPVSGPLRAWQIEGEDQHRPLPAPSEFSNAHPACYDPETGRLYVVIPGSPGQPGLIRCLAWSN
ncbi:YncE family protein [Limisphaera sp. VF-2]|uniref:YncE family protein n=1 Tax=Limisphaera sp. VF-2 TaxID=3400418 RepID=UPI003C286350